MGRENSLVSIIMTAYNSEKYIGAAIKSILEQTYPNWELLIADDCSSDNTRDVISTFKDGRIRRFDNERNLNYLRTRNKLLNHVEGDFICLLDSDDKYEPEYLSLKLKAFEQDPELGICGCWVYLTDEDLRVYGVKELNTDDAEIKREISKSHQFSGSAVMIKKKVVDVVGTYRDFFHGLGHEDYDWYARIVEEFKAKILPKPLYYYRQHVASESKANVTKNIFKKNSHLFVQEFIRERKDVGTDSLQRNDINAIILFANKICMPYINDPSKIYRDQIWPYAHRKMYTQALMLSIKAIKADPLNFNNYKAPLACIKDSLAKRK